jgi:hypothetical protein
MITPAGEECRYYYADYARGRQRQECRLVAQNRESEPWQARLCHGCPVPAILRANACPNLVLEGHVEKGFLGLTRRMAVTAVCTEYLVEVPQPHIGCGHCHENRPGAALFNPQKQ